MAEPRKQPEEKPLAVTYYAAPNGAVWELWRVRVFPSKVTREQVPCSPERRVVRERLRVLLDSPEVLP